MNPTPLLSRCSSCPLNRRRFLARSSALAAGMVGCLAAPVSWGVAERPPRRRLRLVFALHAAKQPGPDWPNKGFDFVPIMNRLERELTARCPGFEFVASQAAGEEAAKKILEEDLRGSIDGYVVFQMNCWNRGVQTLATSGKPLLYADFQFGGSGGFLVYNAAFLRAQSPNVGFVASSRIQDLVEGVKCFEVLNRGGSPADFVAATVQARLARTPKAGRLACHQDQLNPLPTGECVARLKQSKILAVRAKDPGPAGEIMGIPVVNVPFAEINEAWQKADRDEARAVAASWRGHAKAVVGVPRETLETSAAMYLGMKSVLNQHAANAITVDCLGGFYGGHIHAYPCLGFHELNNQGLIGGCECDLRSAAVMVTVTTLTQGRPGYISDPVIDTSRRHIIYAHCVASNRVFGPQGQANPFLILTHSEDRQGASVRSLLPLGYLTTTLEFEPSRKEILLHQAKAVANDPDDRACRTKLRAEPLGDLEKLFSQWDRWGWHRVTAYGDLKEPVLALAEAVGWKVVTEA